MSKYKSRFQDSWLVHESYRSWIEKDNGDVFSAKCKWCLKSFRVGGLGESALKSHATSTKHQKAAAARSGSSKLTTLFRSQGQPAQPKPSSVLSEDCSSQPDVCPSSQNSSVTNFIAREDTLSAEVIWTLHTIKNHQSFNSNTGVGKTFQRMFPDSTIAKSFGLSERKTAYLATFGLAPYIHSLLEKSLTQAPFVILFDESMNKEFQNKQMDFYVRMWDGDIVRTRYFTSKFMGHATAEDMKACFMSVTDQLNLQNVIQLSMDGPNVNWSFHGKINSYLKSEYSIELLNTGSCGIHKVHGACKAAMDACDWHLDTIMKACHKLFSDTPARREDFTKVTGSHLFPLQFCKHRWLENVRVAQRLLDLLPCLKSYVNSVKQGENPAPKSLSYATVKDSVCDLFLPAKLGFFISFSS